MAKRLQQVLLQGEVSEDIVRQGLEQGWGPRVASSLFSTVTSHQLGPGFSICSSFSVKSFYRWWCGLGARREPVCVSAACGTVLLHGVTERPDSVRTTGSHGPSAGLEEAALPAF